MKKRLLFISVLIMGAIIFSFAYLLNHETVDYSSTNYDEQQPKEIDVSKEYIKNRYLESKPQLPPKKFIIDLPEPSVMITAKDLAEPHKKNPQEIHVLASFGDYEGQVILLKEDYDRLIKNKGELEIDLNQLEYAIVRNKEGEIEYLQGSLLEAIANPSASLCGRSVVDGFYYDLEEDALVVISLSFKANNCRDIAPSGFEYELNCLYINDYDSNDDGGIGNDCPKVIWFGICNDDDPCDNWQDIPHDYDGDGFIECNGVPDEGELTPGICDESPTPFSFFCVCVNINPPPKVAVD